MNKRIRELAEQAETKEVGYYYFDREKFAELIVRECSKIIVNGGYWNPAFGEKRPATPPEIAMMIKEYFGVES